MKIAFFVGNFPNTSETFILNQVTGLIDRGHDVEIYCLNSPQKASDETIHSDYYSYDLGEKTNYLEMPSHNRNLNNKHLSRILRTIKSPQIFWENKSEFDELLRTLNFKNFGEDGISLRLLYLADKILKDSIEEEFDVLFCHFGPNGNKLAKLKSLDILGIPLVTMFHGWGIRKGENEPDSFYNHLFGQGDLFLANSENTYRKLIEFGAPKEKTKIHVLGIDTEKFKPKKTDKKTKGFNILTVARLSEEKGLKYGIRGYKKFKDQIGKLKGLEYNIIGYGSLREELEEEALDQEVEESINFLGAKSQEDVINYLQKSDVFLLPSIEEGLGMVILEAQSTATPVIASSVGGVPDIVENGSTGFLVNPRNPDQIADKLETLFKSPEIRKKQGAKGREFVEKEYSLEKSIDGLEATLERIKNQRD